MEGPNNLSWWRVPRRTSGLWRGLLYTRLLDLDKLSLYSLYRFPRTPPSQRWCSQQSPRPSCSLYLEELLQMSDLLLQKVPAASLLSFWSLVVTDSLTRHVLHPLALWVVVHASSLNKSFVSSKYSFLEQVLQLLYVLAELFRKCR